MTTAFGRIRTLLLVAVLSSIVMTLSGCHRTEDDFDDRTLAQRPHVETVTPENRKDIFRP